MQTFPNSVSFATGSIGVSRDQVIAFIHILRLFSVKIVKISKVIHKLENISKFIHSLG
jgi:hypothetical protein